MPAFEALPSMPFWQDLAVQDTQKAAYFYSHLLGWEVGQASPASRGPYRVARKDGLPVAGIIPTDGASGSMWVTYFLAVAGDGTGHAGRAALVDRVHQLGGSVLGSAEVDLGEMTICQDPAGRLFGLMTPRGEDQFVAAGEPGVPVWYEYTAPEKSVVDFYGELFNWELRLASGNAGENGNTGQNGDNAAGADGADDADGAAYFTALSDGAPFLGLRVVEGIGAGMWQTYFGVEDIELAARRVGELGGTLIDGPLLSPFGPIAAVEDPTGAGFLLCEIDPPSLDEVHEADSVLL